MKKNLIAGLAILVPIALTFSIVIYFINTLTGPFTVFVAAVLNQHAGLDSWATLAISRLLILVILIAGILLVGICANSFAMQRLLAFIDFIALRIPVINRIYAAIQETFSALFAAKNPPFSHVAMFPFPHSNCYGIGFITNRDIELVVDQEHNRQLISVFIPSSLNPTAGFYLMLPGNEIEILDIKIEDAIKCIASAGLISAMTGKNEN